MEILITILKALLPILFKEITKTEVTTVETGLDIPTDLDAINHQYRML